MSGYETPPPAFAPRPGPASRMVCVAGTRPNFVKVKPVIDALERAGADVVLVHTGQHYDEVMSDVFFAELGIRRPEHYLGVGPGSHATQTARVMLEFEPVIEMVRPDVVVVFGDVNSTLGAALVATRSPARVAHVEAGLRSGDWTMPEEVNRVVTDRVSDVLFAPSQDAVANLLGEGVPPRRIHLVGNVMVDALFANLDRASRRPVLDDLNLVPGGYGLVTLHRPSNVDQPDVLEGLLTALQAIAADCPLVFPAHPRTAERLSTYTLPSSLTVIKPVGYLDSLALQAGARLVLTDSGGIQEESTVLGTPCLTLRTATERPVTVTEGTNTVVGLDPERIVAEAHRCLRDWVTPRRPALWDGHAAERIARVLTADEPTPPAFVQEPVAVGTP